jgi:hypothetical protein
MNVWNMVEEEGGGEEAIRGREISNARQQGRSNEKTRTRRGMQMRMRVRRCDSRREDDGREWARCQEEESVQGKESVTEQKGKREKKRKDGGQPRPLLRPFSSMTVHLTADPRTTEVPRTKVITSWLSLPLIHLKQLSFTLHRVKQ